MPHTTPKPDRDQCVQACQHDFIKATAKKPVGEVEALRLCREHCDVEPNTESRVNTA